jgi:hypothetical protein
MSPLVRIAAAHVLSPTVAAPLAPAVDFMHKNSIPKGTAARRGMKK